MFFELGSTINAAFGDAGLPAASDQDVVQGSLFPCCCCSNSSDGFVSL